MSDQILRLDLITGISQAVPAVTGAVIPTFARSSEVPSKTSERVEDQLELLRSVYAESSPLLRQAVELLSDMILACRDAIDAEIDGVLFRADDCMLRIQARLTELFALRAIGPGFGVASTALMFSFVNKSGKPFNRAEKQAILRLLNWMRSSPFATLENAVTMTAILEREGLCVDPMPLTDLYSAAVEAGFVDGE